MLIANVELQYHIDACSFHLGSSNQQPINLNGILSLEKFRFYPLVFFNVFFFAQTFLLAVVAVAAVATVAVYFFFSIRSVIIQTRHNKRKYHTKNYTK